MMRLQSDLVGLCMLAQNQQLDAANIKFDDRAAVGVVLAAGGYPGSYPKGDEIFGLDEAAKLPGKVFHAGTLLDGDKVLTNGGRVLCATGLGETVTEAQKNAYTLVDAIDWQGVMIRTDIAYRAIDREQASK
jgi:phosphoribosylamine--glycine ligase